MSFLFGSSGSAPQPFRAPGFQDQGQLLNDLFMGNILGANPDFAQSQISGIQNNIGSLESQLQALQGQLDPRGSRPDMMGQRINTQNQIGQLQNQINSQNQILNQYQSAKGQYQDPMAGIPELNFQQRNPFQFSEFGFNPQTDVADAFTPQAQRIQSILGQREKQQLEGFNEDINSRGLATSGAALEGTRKIQSENTDTLAQALQALAGQQAGVQTQANQFAAQQNQQRELNQAAEIFRQQGATDQQALALANSALQRKQFENTLRRQPQEDLFRLFSLSTGGNPGSPGSPGLLQAVAPAIGSALGGPIGGAIGGLFS